MPILPAKKKGLGKDRICWRVLVKWQVDWFCNCRWS